ncbi:MAG: hypothetical protein CFH05_00369 [Alphaproteobacteria bacterium MarineAlpha3_Bin4]|nr:MAG: hypothetical protein CFH05_00369 [Alphaproteobacteria bacterium MarineAlpha3_Bin4]
MKKVLWSVGILLVLLATAALVGPSLVNWNDYKDDITYQVRKAIGREISIHGDIRITVLPVPAFVAKEVSIANPVGATSPNLARFKSIEVRIALGPLLSGQITVETVRLIDPVIELEVLAEGSKTWEFNLLAGNTALVPLSTGERPAPESKGAALTPTVVLDNFTIENGTITYRDNTAGTVERISGLNARVVAASLNGPFESAGSMLIRGVPLDFDVDVGEIIHNRTLPVVLSLGIKPSGMKLQFNGTLVGLDDVPRFKGNVKGNGANLGHAINAVRQGPPLPDLLGQPFEISGSVVASASAGEIKNLSFRLGSTRASGDVTIEMADALNVAVRLTTKQVDLDKWLTPSSQSSTEAADSASGESGNQTKTTTTAPAPSGSSSAAGFEIPTGINGSLILSADTVVYREGLIRDALLTAELANGEATLSQLSAQFPGGSDIVLFGFLSSSNDGPRFEGKIETTVSDLRDVLKWLDIDIKQVPADRLRKLSLGTKVTVTPKQVQLSGLDLRFDSSRLTGGVTVALQRRPSFGANIALDRIDIDAYLPKPAKKKTKPEVEAESGKAKAVTGSKKTLANKAQANPLARLFGLGAFDANVKARVKRLVYQGAQIKKVVVDGTLYNGDLDIRRLSIARLAGASATLSGKITGLGGLPAMKGVAFEAKAADLSRVMRLVGIEAPIDTRKLGAVAIVGTVDGSFLKPQLNARLTAAGAIVGVKGSVSVLPFGDMLKAEVSVKHKSTVRLLRAVGADYRPAGNIGGIDITAKVEGDTKALRLSGLRGRVGKTALKGDVTLDLSGSRPRLTGALETGALVIDPFLPAKRKATLDSAPRLIPAVWLGPKTTIGSSSLMHRVATRGRWPTEPLDLSVLKSFDADLNFKAPAVIYGKFLLEKTDFSVVVADGVLTTRRLNGVIFGGVLAASARAEAASQNQFRTEIKLTGVDVAEATHALSGKPAADGRLNARLDVTASGRSVTDLISTLNGSGSLALNDLATGTAGQGSALAGLLGLMTAFNQIGGGKALGKANVSGSFKMTNGIARSQDLKLVSGIGSGVAAGNVDLPKWSINVSGKMELAESLLTQIFKAEVREIRQAVPFSIRGRLDAPDIKVDTDALLGSGGLIPGADAFLNKVPKGVGTILKGILGGGATQAQPSSPLPPSTNTQKQPPPSSPQQQKQLKPEDLLKQLFKL